MKVSRRTPPFTATMGLATELCELSMRLAKVFPQDTRQGSLRKGIREVSESLMQHSRGNGVMFPMVRRCKRAPPRLERKRPPGSLKV